MTMSIKDYPEEIQKREAAVVLRKNLQSIYAILQENYDKIKIENRKFSLNKDQLIKHIAEVIKTTDEKSRLSIEDKIRELINEFEMVLSYLKDYRRLVFKYYIEGPKTGGTYVFLTEVEKYCRETEPQILNRKSWFASLFRRK